MNKTLYLLRHCAIPENEQGINASQTDSPLSEIGQNQAQALVADLSKHSYELIIVSPLQRTTQTIQPYLNSLKKKPAMLVEPLTIERDLGKFTNTKSGDGSVTGDIKSQGVGQTSWHPKDGESTVQVGVRAENFLEKLKNRKESSILFVAIKISFAV